MSKSKTKKHSKPNQVSKQTSPSSPDPQEINLLVTLFTEGRYAEAEALTLAQAMTVRFPLHGFGWKALGALFKQLDQNADALIPMQKAAALSPNDAEAHFNLGVVLMELGHPDKAEASYRRTLKIKSNYAEAHNNLGNIFKDLNQLEDAEACYRRALKIKPNYTEAHYNLGKALNDLGHLDEAEVSYRRALEINPFFLEPHYNLGNTLREMGRLKEAEASYRRALQINPDYAEALQNLGITLYGLGLQDEANVCFGRAQEINPYLTSGHSNRLFHLTQNVAVDAETLFTEHCRFGEQFESLFRTNPPQHSNPREPERCLQIGFVSGDLRHHALATFIGPLLMHLANYPQLVLHAYYNHTFEDSVSQQLRLHFNHWHSIASLSDDALAEKIRADGIDILIDLSGHSAKNRLFTFALKPAPVQVTWMGYPCTTGLRSMDYYFADHFILPPGQFDDQFTEKIVQLPASAPFQPYISAPPVNALPALSNGYVTFGSFNQICKINPSVISLWAQILRALPNSRMLLGAMPADGKCDILIDWFAAEGIEPERLSLHPRCDVNNYLALHHQVDICLDTFPYNGGTTTLNALWMGVPTLTLAGHTAAGRSGVAILGHVSLDSYIAQDEADFVEKGLSAVGHLTSLASVREHLRERFEKSAMGQPEMVSAGVECALRLMWQRWCNGLPAESFEVIL